MIFTPILAFLLAAIPQPPNTIVALPEGSVLTAVSSPTAQLYFGIGTNYCATPVSLKIFPLTVSYIQTNLALCATDPAPNVAKQIVAQQQAAAYTITYTLAGKPTVVTIPALIVSIPCTGTFIAPTATSSGSLSLLCK